VSQIIAVTGAGGFVGNVLCRDLLMRGYKVRAIDNFYKGQCDALIELSTYPGFKFVYGDVANEKHVEEFLDGVDGVIHLAAIVGFPQCANNSKLARIVNVDGTKNILQYRYNIPMVFASTGSVYGKVEDVCNEDSALNALTDYGITKRDAEDFVSAQSNTVSFRFATGFGVSPNMRVNLLVNDLTYQAVRNRSMCIFEPKARRTFIHVRDMSRAFIWGLENLFNNNLEYNVYNCGGNHLNWSKKDIAEYIATKTGAFVSYNEFNKDLDQRDYEVDYSRMASAGSNFGRDIYNLIHTCHMWEAISYLS